MLLPSLLYAYVGIEIFRPMAYITSVEAVPLLTQASGAITQFLLWGVALTVIAGLAIGWLYITQGKPGVCMAAQRKEPKYYISRINTQVLNYRVYHLSRNRIKQVIDKSIRKLRHPAKLVCYQKGYTHTVQRRKEMEQRAVLINTNRSVLSDEEIQQHLNLIREITIEEADFTIRTFNCLARSGLSTLGDIIDLINSGPNQFANIRNLSISGQGEVLRKLKEYGADFTDCILYAASNE